MQIWVKIMTNLTSKYIYFFSTWMVCNWTVTYHLEVSCGFPSRYTPKTKNKTTSVTGNRLFLAVFLIFELRWWNWKMFVGRRWAPASYKWGEITHISRAFPPVTWQANPFILSHGKRGPIIPYRTGSGPTTLYEAGVHPTLPDWVSQEDSERCPIRT